MATVLTGRLRTIQDLRAITGHPLLSPAAVQAVWRWRYRTTMVNDEPVEVVTTISAPFSLN